MLLILSFFFFQFYLILLYIKKKDYFPNKTTHQTGNYFIAVVFQSKPMQKYFSH